MKADFAVYGLALNLILGEQYLKTHSLEIFLNTEPRIWKAANVSDVLSMARAWIYLVICHGFQVRETGNPDAHVFLL